MGGNHGGDDNDDNVGCDNNTHEGASHEGATREGATRGKVSVDRDSVDRFSVERFSVDRDSVVEGWKGGLSHRRGSRWVLSLRALVVVLAMMAAALGVLWLDTARVQSASAQLDDAGGVAVPSLGVSGAPAEVTAGPGAATPAPTPGPTRGLGEPVAAASAGALAEGVLVVHVAGAVKHAGVYLLAPNSRVFQAIEAAGGPLPTAELAALNLAAPVSDGVQVLVPTRDQLTSAGGAPAGSGGAGLSGGNLSGAGAGGTALDGADAGAADSQALVNINTASAAELEQLPGIGPVLAERIVVWRTEHGLFASVDALQSVSGIGSKLLAGLRELVSIS